MTVEPIVDTSLEKATEDGRDRNCRLQNAIAFPKLAYCRAQMSAAVRQYMTHHNHAWVPTFVVPAAKNVIESRPVACLEETNYKANTEQC